MPKPEKIKKPDKKKKRMDLRLTFSAKEQKAWDDIRPVIKRALSHGGERGAVLKAWMGLKRVKPESAKKVKDGCVWFGQFLDMIGE